MISALDIELEYYKKRDADALVIAQFLVTQVEHLTLAEAFCMATNWRTNKDESVANSFRNLVLMEKLAKGDDIVAFKISMETYVKSIIDTRNKFDNGYHKNKYKNHYQSIHSKYGFNESLSYRRIREDLIELIDKLLKEPTSLTWAPSKYDSALIELLQDHFGGDIKLEKRGFVISRWSLTPKDKVKNIQSALKKMNTSAFILRMIGL